MVGLGAGNLHSGSVVRRQGCPGLWVDKQGQCGRALPPAGKVLVLGDLVQSKSFIVKWADEFGGIKHAFFQCRIDVTRS